MIQRMEEAISHVETDYETTLYDLLPDLFRFELGQAGGPSYVVIALVNEQGRLYVATQRLGVFREITGSLVRCRYVTNPVPDPGRVSVWLGGQRVPRDPTRLTGWDWHRVEAGEFVLYGDACQAAQRDGARVTTRYDCPDEDAR
jgi:hypothetical protein